MQIEILKFLLEASAHLQPAQHTGRADENHHDLQAVDRILPDSDWFEGLEGRVPARCDASDLWPPPQIRFEP